MRHLQEQSNQTCSAQIFSSSAKVTGDRAFFCAISRAVSHRNDSSSYIHRGNILAKTLNDTWGIFVSIARYHPFFVRLAVETRMPYVQRFRYVMIRDFFAIFPERRTRALGLLRTCETVQICSSCERGIKNELGGLILSHRSSSRRSQMIQKRSNPNTYMQDFIERRALTEVFLDLAEMSFIFRQFLSKSNRDMDCGSFAAFIIIGVESLTLDQRTCSLLVGLGIQVTNPDIFSSDISVIKRARSFEDRVPPSPSLALASNIRGKQVSRGCDYPQDLVAWCRR